MTRRAAAIALAFVAALACAASAARAHDEAGRIVPALELEVQNAGGLERVLTLRAVDADDGTAVGGARVEASARMTDPHDMRTYFGGLREGAPGTYRARVRFPMPATWTITVELGGDGIAKTRSRFAVVVPPLRAAAAAAGSAAQGTIDAPGEAVPVAQQRIERRGHR